MTSLNENLAALTASLPDVPAELQGLKDQAERVERGVVDLVNELAEREAQAGARLDELEQALTALQHGSAGERSQLESELQAFGDRLDGSLEELRHDQVDLSQALEAAGAALVGLKDELGQAATSSQDAGHEAVQALGGLSEAGRSAEAGLRAAFEVAEDEVRGLGAAVEESVQGVEQALGALGQRLQALADRGRQRIAQTALHLNELQSAHEAEVPQQRARLNEAQREICEEMRERIERELKARLSESTRALLAALSEMAASGQAAAAACQGDREGLGADLEALREATRPLPAAIGAVRQAAEQVGLSWG